MVNRSHLIEVILLALTVETPLEIEKLDFCITGSTCIASYFSNPKSTNMSTKCYPRYLIEFANDTIHKIWTSDLDV